MTDTVATPLPARIRRFLDEPLFMSVATVDPDGAPRQTVTWYRIEPDGRILLNSKMGRRWPTNLLRDGRLAMSVVDPADGYSWVGLTGEVDAFVDDIVSAREDIVALAHRYHPEGPSPDSLATYRTQARISFLVRITSVHDHLED